MVGLYNNKKFKKGIRFSLLCNIKIHFIKEIKLSELMKWIKQVDQKE